MGLLAARNAGIEVPDKSVDSAIKYFASMTGDSGAVGYSGGLGALGQSIARPRSPVSFTVLPSGKISSNLKRRESMSPRT
ncbi:MAG: hypothetical protein R3C56_23390 [Pirellulaceae bacterium]